MKNPKVQNSEAQENRDGAKEFNKKELGICVLAILLIFIILSAFITFLSFRHWTRTPPTIEIMVAELRQGDDNISNGCLFVLTKGAGNRVNMEDYIIRVCKEGEMPVSLKWPEDGNITYDVTGPPPDEWWEETESIGFDAPPELQAQNIIDGDIIEVWIVYLKTGEVVFREEFVYRD